MGGRALESAVSLLPGVAATQYNSVWLVVSWCVRKCTMARGSWHSGRWIAVSERTMVTAIIMINVEPSHTATAAEALSEMNGISEVYSVAGNFDLVALVRVKKNEMLADLVARRIRSVEGIMRTETMIAFRAYSRFDLVSLFSVD